MLAVSSATDRNASTSGKVGSDITEYPPPRLNRIKVKKAAFATMASPAITAAPTAAREIAKLWPP
jgi:hypothetical protein